jgi:hypothetical protein
MTTLPTLNGRVLPGFPCGTDKRPLTPHGFQNATADPLRFAHLFFGHPGSLVGVATGEISGVDILDVDPDGLSWLAANELRLPPTRRHETRRGVHVLFRHASGLKGSTSKIAPGVDVKAEGGYVIWWPADGYSVIDLPVADWPVWLLTLATNKTSPQRRDDGHLLLITDTENGRGYTDGLLPPATTIEKEVAISSRLRKTVDRWSREETFAYYAVKNAIRALAVAPVGHRNDVLNAKGYALGRLLVRGWVDGPKVVRALWSGAEECGYIADHGEAATVAAIRHALIDGMARPYPDLKPVSDSAPVPLADLLNATVP